jgi:hypothetical protein
MLLVLGSMQGHGDGGGRASSEKSTIARVSFVTRQSRWLGGILKLSFLISAHSSLNSHNYNWKL